MMGCSQAAPKSSKGISTSARSTSKPPAGIAVGLSSRGRRSMIVATVNLHKAFRCSEALRGLGIEVLESSLRLGAHNGAGNRSSRG